jgi:hypothetical protein
MMRRAISARHVIGCHFHPETRVQNSCRRCGGQYPPGPTASSVPSALYASARTGSANRTTLDSNSRLAPLKLKSLTQLSSDPVANFAPSGATARTFTASSWSSNDSSTSEQGRTRRSHTQLHASATPRDYALQTVIRDRVARPGRRIRCSECVPGVPVHDVQRANSEVLSARPHLGGVWVAQRNGVVRAAGDQPRISPSRRVVKNNESTDVEKEVIPRSGRRYTLIQRSEVFLRKKVCPSECASTMRVSRASWSLCVRDVVLRRLALGFDRRSFDEKNTFGARVQAHTAVWPPRTESARLQEHPP